MSKIAYIYDKNLRFQCDKLPTMKYRATVVQDLINSYGLMRDPNLLVFPSERATYKELVSFHSVEYIQYILSINEKDSREHVDELADSFGLSYDCPIMSNTFDFVSSIAGASITASKLLNSGHKRVINWFGGWHHAFTDKAQGFCYVNDIVLAIKALKFSKILYLDLDVHHGDGVQKAFEGDKKVVTFSIHKCLPGFYPGSGTIDEIGLENGLNYTVNVPLLDGIGNATYKYMFQSLFTRVFDSFKPEAMVVQCGADILAGDPLGECNVTLETMGECIEDVLSRNIPTMFLGGGGYNKALVARYWTYLTATILKVQIDEDIPSEANFFKLYTPTFELPIRPIMGRKDRNTKEYLENLVDKVNKVCDSMKIIEENELE